MLRAYVGFAVWLLSADFVSAESRFYTDANLITGIDVSGSISRTEMALEFEGIADALLDPMLADAFTRGGQHGRVGFALFTWSSAGYFYDVIPWTIIDSAASAAGIANKIVGSLTSAPMYLSWMPNLATDISSSIRRALNLIKKAPFRTNNEIINIVTNGRDNIGVEPDGVRDIAGKQAVTINVLLLNKDLEMSDYFRKHVLVGRGAFVRNVNVEGDFSAVMREKFLSDLLALESP